MSERASDDAIQKVYDERAELRTENERLRAALDAVFDEAVDVHENPHPMMGFSDILRHRLGTFGHGYAVKGFEELLAERDALRAALEKIAAPDAASYATVKAIARVALGDRGSGQT